MVILVENEELQNCDFIQTLYNHGLLHIIEKIFHNLTKKSIQACLETSPDWKSIVKHITTSERSRFQSVLNDRISRNFRLKKATIVSSKLTSTRHRLGVNVIKCLSSSLTEGQCKLECSSI